MKDDMRQALGVALVGGVVWRVGIVMDAGLVRDHVVGLGGVLAVIAVIALGVELIRSGNRKDESSEDG